MVNVYNITVGQDDCPHTFITRQIKSLTIYVMNTSDEPNGYQKTFSIFITKNEQDMREALNQLKQYPNIRGICVLGKKKNIISLKYSFPKTSAYQNVMRTGFRLHPIVIKGGIEKWFIVSESNDLINEGKQILNDSVTHVISLKRLSTNDFITSYSRLFNGLWKIRLDSQTGGSGSQLISDALKAGYYDWPRQSSLTELSKSINVPRTTLTYKIRKVEKSIFSDMSDTDF